MDTLSFSKLTETDFYEIIFRRLWFKGRQASDLAVSPPGITMSPKYPALAVMPLDILA